MSRRRKTRTRLSVSLFPFLAVLICTLGVLIVLLVIATKSAEMQADADQEKHQARAEQQSASLKQVVDQVEETETLIEIVSSNRPDLLADLNKSREYRGHLEAEIQRLKLDIAGLDSALNAPEPDDLGQVDVLLQTAKNEELSQQVLAAETELSNRRKDFQANSRVTYSIVPHAGSGGTFRRPIFLESRGKSIFIQPLGIELKRDDFALPLGPGNPLDAAVLAIREYWQSEQTSGNDGSPYPLIVVRPDGAEGYAICRRALASWEDEFGYELVESDKELDFGAVDNQLKSVVESAVAEAKSRQQKMLAARPLPTAAPIQQVSFGTGRGSYGRQSDQRPGLTVSGSGGGFVVNSGWEELYQQRENLSGSSFESAANARGDGGTDSGTGAWDQQARGSSSDAGRNQAPGSTFLAKDSGRSDRQSVRGQGSAFANSGQAPAGSSAPSSSNPTSASAGADSSQAGSQASGESFAQAGSAGTTGSSSASATTPGAPRDGQSFSGQGGENCECNQPVMYQHLSVAKSKGRDWAVPNKSPGATAYVRPIRIVCTATELEIRSPLGVEKRIPLENGMAAALDPLTNEIWQQIESWGVPGERSYWKPELRISVVAGGENNFDQLQGLLFESGVQVMESQR